VLVVAQIALAVVLLSAAGLMVSTTVRLSRVNPGFAADHVLTFRIALLGQRYSTAPARVAFVSDVLERCAAIPGVRAAAISSVVPFGGVRNANVVEIEGRPEREGSRSIIDQRHVSAGYFQTMKIPLVSGRLLTEADDARSERVTLINRTMAQHYFPHESPINRRVRTAAGFDSGIWFRIVGIVDDVRHIALSRDPIPEMYHPIAQTAVPIFTVAIRTAGDPASMMPAARATVRAVDPNLPIYEIRTMEERIAASFSQTRGTMLLLLATAILAAALSGVAIYGSIWYSVVQRTPEIGIRIALGAPRASVFRKVVAGAIVLAVVGGVIGAAAAMAGGTLLRSLLFDTRTTDPFTYAAVISGVLALAIGASLIPAFRAMRVDPITALRQA
jgi:predicted permease